MHKNLKYSLMLLLVICLITFGFSFLFNLIGRTYAFSAPWRLIFMFLASACSSVIITYVVISTAPVLKDYLHTLRSLLRLDTLSHPLLLKLQQAAPSSFHHSLMVSNLAHRAAKAIGADALLCRIGGYYHDIGKTINPENYTENRTAIKKITAIRTMAKKISQHVQQGVDLAQKYQLPQEVVNLIPQSHGTSAISFLYQEAKEQRQPIKKSELRYPGPKPLSKEAGILMLADTVEAKIRSHKQLTLKMIEEIVDETIKIKLTDRQLELSGLTRFDLKKIRQALIEGIKIIHHQRISYK